MGLLVSLSNRPLGGPVFTRAPSRLGRAPKTTLMASPTLMPIIFLTTMPMAQTLVDKFLLHSSQATSTTVPMALDLADLLEELLELPNHLRHAFPNPFQSSLAVSSL
jgi:hypothetical protein